MAFSKTEKWIIDRDHTKIGFEVPHLLISSVEGQFNEFTGEVMYDIANKDIKDLIKRMKFNVNIKANSIDTGNEKRDTHLKSPDFFNVKKKGHESIKFQSSSVTSVNGKRFRVNGNLTINKVTKPVTIAFKYLGSAKAYGILKVAFIGKVKIKREDFGLNWNDGEVKATNFAGKIAEAAGAVGNEVKIEIKLQAKRASDL